RPSKPSETPLSDERVPPLRQRSMLDSPPLIRQITGKRISRGTRGSKRAKLSAVGRRGRPTDLVDRFHQFIEDVLAETVVFVFVRDPGARIAEFRNGLQLQARVD